MTGSDVRPSHALVQVHSRTVPVPALPECRIGSHIQPLRSCILSRLHSPLVLLRHQLPRVVSCVPVWSAPGRVYFSPGSPPRDSRSAQFERGSVPPTADAIATHLADRGVLLFEDCLQ